MKKYVKVMDGATSNAGGFNYKIGEINEALNWNPSEKDPAKMGGFNFSTEDKILRWLHRGNTIYDVIIPEDANIILCDTEKGIYRTNKIIINNPRSITDNLVLDLYSKTSLSNKILAQCLQTLLWEDRILISKQIIKDKVNTNNVNEFITEFENYTCDSVFNYNKLGEQSKIIYDLLKEIQSPILISLLISKPPYEKILSSDRIINLTGQSGAGKSYYAQKNFNTSQYEIIDTDEIFSDKKYEESTGLNKALGKMFREKYNSLPNLADDFDLIYNEIINYCHDINKTIVIDCAQFHCIKNINNLKGKIIIIRTDIDTCYNRTISRWIENHRIKKISYTEEELNQYKNRKKSIYEWYKFTNEFIKKIDSL